MIPRPLVELALDLRLAVRLLRRRPGFFAMPIAVIALGIGAATIIFSGVHGVLLRPLPFASPDRLIVAWGERRAAARERVELSWPEFEDWARESRSFTSVGALPFATLGATITGAGEPVRIAAVPVSDRFFHVLGARPQLGRTFVGGEDRPGAPRVIVLSDGLWRSRFGADTALLERGIVLDGEPYTVIGVMPPAFDFPRATDAWTTLGAAVGYAAEDRRLGFLMMIGRLREGLAPDAARDELSAVVRRLGSTSTLPEPPDGAVLAPLADHIFGAARPASLLLLGAAALLLVLAMANVAGLLLTRAVGREHEMSVRLSLGAGRGRLLRQLVAESLVVAAAGGAAGVLLASPATSALAALVPSSVPRASTISLDGSALLVAALLTLLVALVAGTLPALRAIPARSALVLRAGTRGGADPRTRRLLDALIVAQVGLTLALLIGAGLIVRSVDGLERVPLGFEARDVITAQVSLPESAYPEVEQQRRFMEQLIERVGSSRDVIGAAAVLVRPLEGPVGFNFPFRAEGQDSAAAAANPMLNYQSVSPGYFAAMRIPVVRGREFTPRDREEGPGVVIVGESLAARLWPGDDAIGRRLRLPNQRRPREEWLEVVGVVRDLRARELVATTLDVYVPMAQSQFVPQFLVARTRSDALSAVPAIRAELEALDPSVPLASIATMEQRRDAMLAAPRFGAVVLAAFAAAALLLATIGLYGVLAYAVAQRSREIGIRVALGALPSDVRRLISGHAGRLVVAGIVVGIVPAWLGARALRGFLFGVGTFDWPTVAGTALVLAAAALAASWFPARRASRVDPAVTMRAEV